MANSRPVSPANPRRSSSIHPSTRPTGFVLFKAIATTIALIVVAYVVVAFAPLALVFLLFRPQEFATGAALAIGFVVILIAIVRRIRGRIGLRNGTLARPAFASLPPGFKTCRSCHKTHDRSHFSDEPPIAWCTGCKADPEMIKMRIY